MCSSDLIFNGGTITSAINRGEGEFLIGNSGGSGFRLINDYTDAKFYVANTNGTADKHFQFWRGTKRLCQMGAAGMYAHIGFTDTSDMRLKDKVYDVTDVLSKVPDIDVFGYTRNDLETDNKYIGVSAQQLQVHFPDIVTLQDDGYLSVSYGAVGCVALQGVKELKAENDSLKQQLNDLSNRLQTLEKLCL